MNRDFVAGVIVGVLLAIIWRGLNRPTPPTRPANQLDIPKIKTDDLKKHWEKLGRTG